MGRWIGSACRSRLVAFLTAGNNSLFCGTVTLLFLLLGGCSSVVVLQPLPQVTDPQEQSMLAGEWLTEDTVVTLRFSSKGIGCLAGLDWRDDHFQLDEGDLIVTKSGDKKYFSVRFRENGKWQEWYYFVRYQLTEWDDLIIWPPVVGSFENAVASGVLQGTVEKGTGGTRVTMTSSPEKLLDFLDGQGDGLLFHYEEPIVLRRLFPRPGMRR